MERKKEITNKKIELDNGEDVKADHTTVEEFDEKEAITVVAKKRASKLISIRIPISMMQKLRIIASNKGDVGYQHIIRTYIAEGLTREMNQLGSRENAPATVNTLNTAGTPEGKVFWGGDLGVNYLTEDEGWLVRK